MGLQGVNARRAPQVLKVRSRQDLCQAEPTDSKGRLQPLAELEVRRSTPHTPV
jgi:hypothetical protein